MIMRHVVSNPDATLTAAAAKTTGESSQSRKLTLSSDANRTGLATANPWKEEYSGGSAEAERYEFEQLARDIMQIQTTVRKQISDHGVPPPIQRAFHAKATVAVDEAMLRFNADLPAALQVGFAIPDEAYVTKVRFSNAASSGEPDFAKDLRGIALRIQVDDSTSVDLLATNFPVSHARDARQFVEFAKATAGGRISLLGLARLARAVGIRETVRMARNVRSARKRPIDSVATQTYWSRGALTWGPELAARYLLRPAPGTPPGPTPSKTDPTYLSTEAACRLRQGDIRFELCIQRYVDDEVTPIEDTAVEWKVTDSPVEPVAILTLKQTDITSADSVEAQARAAALDSLAFNPWNTTYDFRPLGNLNRARKAAYDASAAHRSQIRWHTETPCRNLVFGGLALKTYSVVNRRIPWYRMWSRFALLNLDVFRSVLRAHNLIDTEPHAAPRPRSVPLPIPEDVRAARTPNGSFNDLSAPEMGAVGATFGRNLKPDYRPKLFDEPNPLTVSERLLTRETFLPARSLNVIAAAWIQFQVHDWANRRRHPLGFNDVEVPLPRGTTYWLNTPDGAKETKMRIAGDKPSDDSNDTEPVFINEGSHWWDGSEVYGSDQATIEKLRDGPKLWLQDGYLPTGLGGMELTGFNQGWWLGLSALHTLFAREHNVVCEELRAHYQSWSDDRIFNTARLIVSALIAKIHTLEWTPAMLTTEAIDQGMKANWYGPPSNQWLTRLGVWLIDTHASVGIPATKPDHHGVPFSITEDFITIYRMHPLIPDDYRFADHQTGEQLHTRTFRQITGAKAHNELRSIGLDNVMYSLGIAHPGAITLNNYPNSLRKFERSSLGLDGAPRRELIDLAVVDLVRERRRGIPRYNDFRAGLHKPRIEHWKQLSHDPEAVRRIRKVYRNLDEVDTMIGLFAETPPEGFAISDTAFRIFILMASRRIQSDRFLTVDFRPEIYSPLGMDWVQRNNMSSVISRHCPGLAALLPRDRSAFAPWREVEEQR